MLTKWAKEVLLENIQDNVLPSINTNEVNVGFASAKSVLNESVFINAFAYYHGYSVKVAAASNTDAIWIGSGSTPATENDYFLETPITSGCSGSTTKVSVYDSDTNSIINRLIVTITNSGSNDVVINEICKTCSFDTASTQGGTLNNGRKGIMVDRTVLDSPVTIPAGESGVIHYDFIYFDGSPEPTTNASEG